MKLKLFSNIFLLLIICSSHLKLNAQSASQRISFGFEGGLNKYWGEFSDNQFWLYGDIFMRYNILDELSAQASFSLIQPRWNTEQEAIRHYPSYFDIESGKYRNSILDIGDMNMTRIMAADLLVSYNFFPQSTFVPYVFLGLGYMSFEPKAGATGEDGPLPNNSLNRYSKSSITVPFGVGFESYLTDDLCLNGKVTFRITGTDYLDDLADRDLQQEDFRDAVWASGNDKLLTFGIGLSYYINNPRKKAPDKVIQNVDGMKPGEWEEFGIKTNYVSSVIFKDNLVFAGMNGEGVIVSDDNGVTWKPVNNGLSYKFIDALCASGKNLYAGTWGKGVFISSDNGQTWTESGLENRECRDFAVSGGIIWLGTDKGIFRTADDGNSWVGAGLEKNTVYSVALIGNTLFAGTYSQGIFRSSDNGATWEQVLKTPDNRLTVRDIINSGNLIFAATDSSGIFVSSDKGASWKQKIKGLATFKESGLDKYSLSRISSLVCSGDSVFAATWNHGVFLTTDGGDNWKHCGLKKGAINTTLAIKGGLMFAGEYWGNIFRSENTGRDWEFVMAGINITLMNSIYIGGGNIYIGTAKGLLHSENGGDSWSYKLKGNTNYVTEINGKVFACNTNGLYAAESGNKRFIKLTKDSIDINSVVYPNGEIFASSRQGGVFLSEDKGANWRQVKAAERDDELLTMYADDGKLYVGSLSGLFIAGSPYTEWSKRELRGSDIHCIIKYEGSLFAATENSIFTSPSAGVWNRINQGSLTPKIRYVNTLVSQDGKLFAGAGNGVFVTDDNAKTWKHLGLDDKNISGLSLKGNILYAVTRHEAGYNALLRLRLQ